MGRGEDDSTVTTIDKINKKKILIWIPLFFCFLGTLLLQISITSCNFVSLLDGVEVTIHGRCVDKKGRSSEGNFNVNKFGMAQFKSVDNGLCCTYTNSPGGVIKFSKLSTLVALVLGYISFASLLFTVCCIPLTNRTKWILFKIVLAATLFTSIAFSFYWTELCVENGCVISSGGSLCAASGIFFYLTTISVAIIKPGVIQQSSKTKRRRHTESPSTASRTAGLSIASPSITSPSTASPTKITRPSVEEENERVTPAEEPPPQSLSTDLSTPPTEDAKLEHDIEEENGDDMYASHEKKKNLNTSVGSDAENDKNEILT